MNQGIRNIKKLHGEQRCPECNADLHEFLSDGRHGTRLMGVEYAYGDPERYDGVSEWQCPDCYARFGRWSGKQLKEGESEKRFGWSEEMEQAGI